MMKRLYQTMMNFYCKYIRRAHHFEMNHIGNVRCIRCGITIQELRDEDS